MNQAFRGRWILANAIGFPLGSALGGGLARILEQPHVGISSSGRGALVLAIDAGITLGVFGAAVGLAQWFALRRRAQALVLGGAARWWTLSCASGLRRAGP